MLHHIEYLILQPVKFKSSTQRSATINHNGGGRYDLELQVAHLGNVLKVKYEGFLKDLAKAYEPCFQSMAYCAEQQYCSERWYSPRWEDWALVFPLITVCLSVT